MVEQQIWFEEKLRALSREFIMRIQEWEELPVIFMGFDEETFEPIYAHRRNPLHPLYKEGRNQSKKWFKIWDD